MTANTASPPGAFGVRLRASVPGVRAWLGGMIGWGAAMCGSALYSLTALGRMPDSNLAELTVLYFAGGMLAWLVALPVIRFFSYGHTSETRFAAAFLFLGVGTVAFTAFLFAMQYRLFYAQWHAPFATRIWAFQFVFTSASAVYQFAVLGLRLAFPLALGFLVAASLYLARRSR